MKNSMMMKKTLLTLMAAFTAVMGFADTTVTPPEGATIETYNITNGKYWYTLGDSPADYSYYQGSSKNVAIVGSDVYIQGLSLFVPSGWVKGTISSDGKQVVFTTGQSFGTYTTQGQTFEFYLVGQSEESATATDTKDIVFDYNQEEETLTLNSNYLIQESLDPGALNQYVGYWETLALKKGVTEKPIEVPEGLTPQQYIFKGSQWQFDSEGHYAGSESVAWNVNVAFHGTNEVYIQGLCEWFPTSWVKGTIDDDEVTFEKGQYFGKTPYGSAYLGGYYFNNLDNLVLIYDKETNSFSGGSYYMLVNSSKTEFNPFDVYSGVTITKVMEKTATPANPIITEYQAYNSDYGYGYMLVNIPTIDTGGEGMVTDKLSYQVYQDIDGVTSVYTFTQDLYRDIPETSMTEIPYNYADDYDIWKGGSQICFYENSLQFKRIGIQSIYRGGGVEKRSDIVWYDIETAGIAHLDADGTGEERFFDLQGRKVSGDTKGLLIKQVRKADGSLKTVKVVRK